MLHQVCCTRCAVRCSHRVLQCATAAMMGEDEGEDTNGRQQVRTARVPVRRGLNAAAALTAQLRCVGALRAVGSRGSARRR